MDTFFPALPLSGPFIPHGHCYLWRPGLVWLHGLSDGLIALAYGAIAIALVYVVQRRPDVPFPPLFWLFAAFIAACGLTHLLGIWTLWVPTYWISGSVKAITALVSIYTAAELIPRIPLALALPSPAQLAELNQTLEGEIRDRTEVENHLRQAEAEVRRLNQDLETRVQQRTAQLEEAKQRIEKLLAQEQQARSTLEQAKDNLQYTAERLSLALSAAQMGSWEWVVDQPEQFWSPQTERLLGFTPGTVPPTAERWIERIYPSDRPAVQALLNDAIERQDEFSAQYRIRWENGDLRWLSIYGRVVVTDGCRRLVGVVQDTTDRKRAELSLQASENRFRTVFEQAAVGMARLSPSGHWIQVNQKLCEILGYESYELIGKSFQDITYGADQAHSAEIYQRLITGQATSCQLEKRYRRKDGHPLWTLVTVSAESMDSKEVSALITIIEDIEERKAAREELLHRADELANTNLVLAHTTAMLERRNAELDQFAYVASHDLKAPLRAISNLAEWIGEDLAGQIPEENRHQLELLRSRVQRMEGLINGLLEYSRVGRRERKTTQVDVGALLEQVLDSLDPPSGFDITMADDMPTLFTHSTALSQVFANLINNAIKHHDRGQGSIHITWENQGAMIQFAIADDGPGIDPQYHEKIFTIFQTLKARDDFESTGIGLSVVKKIVESENGHIWLTSALGQGTTFYFTWPVMKVRDDGIPGPGTSPTPLK